MPHSPSLCPGCGGAVPDNAPAYCPACVAAGAKASEPARSVTPELEVGRRPRLSNVALLAILAVVLAAGIVIARKRLKYLGPHVPFANGKGRLYYRGGVTAEQARAAAKYLTEIELFDKNPHATVDIQLLKTGDSYEVRFIVSKEALSNDPIARELGRIVAHELSGEVFGGAPCVAVFCDQKFEPLR